MDCSSNEDYVEGLICAIIKLKAAIHAIENDWRAVGMSAHRGSTSALVNEALSFAEEAMSHK